MKPEAIEAVARAILGQKYLESNCQPPNDDAWRDFWCGRGWHRQRYENLARAVIDAYERTEKQP